MIKKHVEIEDIGVNCEGICRIDDKVYFVPGAFPKDIVTLKVKKDKGRYAQCELVGVEESAQYKILPRCDYYYECGGCHMQNVEYLVQLDFKQKIVKDTLKHVGGLDVEVNKVIGSMNNYAYRNKVSFTVTDVDGETKVGLVKEGSYDLIEIDKCRIAKDEINNVLTIINKFIATYNIKAYNYDTKVGYLRNVVVRVLDNAILITLVTADKNIPNINNLVTMLSSIENFGLDLNINKGKKGKILSNKFIHVAGIDKLYGMEDGVRYPVSSYSFMQINDYIKDKIYTNVENSIPKDHIVVDAYSGAGLLSNIMAKRCKYVYAIEIIADAIENSKQLSLDNGIKNIESICGDVKDVLPKVVKGKDKDKMSIILDPPRVGCDKSVLETILKSGVKNIVYISCNVSTLARDLKILNEKYVVKNVQPYDMFPQTKHIETVVCLQKRV